MKRKSKIIVALAAICALGAVPTASASAAEAHWYIGGTIMAENAPHAITGTGTGTSSLSATIATVNINITCTTEMSTAGSILNPTGGGMGTASGIILSFSGCTVDPAAQHCTVKGVTHGDPAGTITTAELTGTAEAAHQATFSPPGGATGTFVTIELSGCATGGLNTTYAVTGTATGAEAAAGSGKLVFAAGTSHLKLGGIAATFLNETDVTTTGGSIVSVNAP